MSFRITTPAGYTAAYEESVRDPGAFWAEIGGEFEWISKWTKTVSPDFTEARTTWFIDGKLNMTVNCLDRHLASSGEKTAILWEPNDPAAEGRRITYGELHAGVCRFANGLKRLGIAKGDRICFYMPMIPELVIGILACARIGAIHSVVFAGFSAVSLAERIKDAACKMVICSDFNSRGPKNIPVKAVVDEALTLGCDSVEKVIVCRHKVDAIAWLDGRDMPWDEISEGEDPYCEPAVMDSEDPLFILYTSGSTGKPKGVVHTCGGYMVYAGYTFANVFQYEPGDIYWCTADIGWITGHSYMIYGPLLNGATSLMFEGVPTWPDASRFWKICEKYKVNIFYTAPTAIRALMAAGDHFTEGHDLSSLRILGTVGEPINEEAWHWYHHRIGRGVAPVIDTWWQTETGGIMITPLPGITDTKPCYASYPLPGIMPVLVDPSGREITDSDVEGLLCIRYPWPSVVRTAWNDHERCRQAYFSAFPGLYFTGDGAKRDKDGRYRIIGRVDDVINVSGHRFGTAEIENAINQHDNIVESAVVGCPHPIKSQGMYAFIIALDPVRDEGAFQKEVNDIIVKMIGPIARTDEIMIVSGLPKTRSGKIMRRILRKVAERDISALGDTSTLLNPEVVDEILAKANLSR